MIPPASKASFRFPITSLVFDHFVHPDPESGLSSPHAIDGTLYAGNGHIAIRATRGQWLPSDFPPATETFKERLTSLPWSVLPPADHDGWRALDNYRSKIYSIAPISLFREDCRRQPSPVWLIAGHHLIRLSHLQLLARLPSAEVNIAETFRHHPLFIRFNGGEAMVPKDKTLQTYSRELFKPTYHVLDGYRQDSPIGRKAIIAPAGPTHFPKPEPALEGWPPLDHSEN
jgi:hypothetical protein